jgi:hypothetical protein
MVRSNDKDFEVKVTADGEGMFKAEVKLPLTTAAKVAFASQKTRPPSRATLFRWIRKGKCGVRLESRRFNGNYQTSVEAIMRFVQAVDCATENPLSKESRRSNELKRVSRVLDDLGI